MSNFKAVLSQSKKQYDRLTGITTYLTTFSQLCVKLQVSYSCKPCYLFTDDCRVFCSVQHQVPAVHRGRHRLLCPGPSLLL